ncbi:MAG: hypothetical protein C5B57_08780 [Blastocatellia bacterium]|nr:MAG: hypothetical protein C5B57_08780 [Blastocatellia bacterium]
MAYVVFSHGLDNKPEQEYLCQLWKRKLAHDDGLDIDGCGVASTLNYWADVLYPSPDTNLAAYENVGGDIEALNDATDLRTMPHKDDERLRRLARTLDVDPDTVEENQPTPAELAAVRAERVPVPAWLRKRIMARFVRDAHHYFFNVEFSPRPGATFRVRDELRRRFMKCLQDGSGSRPLVVVSHSMGTIIAYDCLRNERECPVVDGLMTIGSPLGLDEVQDFFPDWTRADGFPSVKLNGPWVNMFDPLDVVCGADPGLANDYERQGKPVVEDIREDNWGTWRHSISKYLQGKKLRRRLAEMLGV